MISHRFHKLPLSWLLALSAAYSVPASSQGFTDFALYDQEGLFYQVSRLESELALLIIHQLEDSTSSDALIKAASARGLLDDRVFVAAVNPEIDASRDAVRKEMSILDVELPVLLDSSQTVASSLGAVRTGEAFLIDTRRLSLIYRGPLEEGIEVARTRTDAGVVPYSGGEPIDFSYIDSLKSRGVSYAADVAPLFMTRCAGCHTDGGLAPWPMTGHRMLQGWSPMIREVLLTRRMPPGQIDDEIGDWTDTHQLTDAEMALLLYWIDGGARNDDSADPLADRPRFEPHWPLGEPDLVIDIPEQSVPATGIVDFVYERMSIPTTKDYWVGAVSYLPGDASVLHSVLAYSVAKDSPPVDPFALISAEGTEFFSLFVPGKSTDVFLPDSGFHLTQDSDLVVKIRYLSSGRATTDQTSIGLHFLDAVPQMALETIVLDEANFIIPAGSSNETIVVTSQPFASDFLVEAFAPQMHGRGKSMSIVAQYPDGLERLLFSVPNYNFNWQLNYTLQDPIQLPAGSRLISSTTFDNSELNPFSLAPEQDALPGSTSWDEILNHYVRVYRKSP